MKVQFLLAVVFNCTFLAALSQEFSYNAAVKTAGFISSEDELPFWMYTNTARELGATSSFTSTAGVTFQYQLSENSNISLGANAYYRNDVTTEFQRKNLYAAFQNSWFAITLGAKEEEEKAMGLSSTNQSFLLSGNNRPLPGLRIETAKPIRISNTISVDASLAHYQLNDDRFVSDTRLHTKHLGVWVSINEANRLYAKIHHVAQWAGNSPQFGELPNDAKAFVDVFFAREAQESNEVGEVANAVGNHIGSYTLMYHLTSSLGKMSFYHEHPFEDGSGTRLANFPDGVWGWYWNPKKSNFVKGLLYEFTTTKDQSGSFGVGQDNYFGNRIYRSSYTYEGIIIGFPFILNDPNRELNSTTISIVSNRVVVHHFGVAGSFKGIDWKLKSSFVKSFGRFITPFPEPITSSHHFLEGSYATTKYGSFSAKIGFDTSNLTDTIFGGGIEYQYSF